ncbi:MAG: hypothetical protein E7655_07070 [Ruminococcaceae bacterium]|nr:hypothetical protein [Oscillospiraceae bacterium]
MPKRAPYSSASRSPAWESKVRSSDASNRPFGRTIG